MSCYSLKIGLILKTFAQKHRPEILFLDIGLPGISGIEVADCVRKDFPYMEIVFISADENHSRDAIRLLEIIIIRLVCGKTL